MKHFKKRFISSFKSVFLFLVFCGVVMGIVHVAELRAQAAVSCSNAVPNSCTTSFGLPKCYTCTVPTGSITDCVPDNTLCDSLNTNQCRADSCLPNATPGVTINNNPTGCDYTDVSSTVNSVCINCLPPDTSTNCGNGVCEADQGENCQNCPADCLIPGFTDQCPADPNSLNPLICSTSITFPGPPFNVTFSHKCESGDLCTESHCATFGSNGCSTPAPVACSFGTHDFCCPANCQPPANGTSCGNNESTCDIDCLIPVSCQPTPSPTPIPSSSPGLLEGDGVGITTCSLNKNATTPPAANLLLLGVVLGGLGAGIYLRRRED
jgi:hypothetical protein